MKIKGEFAIIRTGKRENPRWLFFKMKGKEALPGSDITRDRPNSIKTGRSIEELTEEEPADIKDFT
jgi:hypothetical protein